MRLIFVLPIIMFCSLNLFGQERESKTSNEIYHIKKAIDIPLTGAAVGWSLYGMSVIYGRDPVPEAEINALSVQNINKFDRPVADNYDPHAEMISDKLFYGSIPLPLLLLIDKQIRHDGLKIGLLYLECMGSTGTLYTTSAMTADRFRPYAYNAAVDINKKTRGGARNSFFAGHPALVATGTFFMAKVYTDYHPEMKGKGLLFGLAGALTASTAALRIKAGEHFYSDVIVGATIGTLSGILIPQLHKNKNYDEKKISFYPNYQGGSTGITAIWHLGR